MFAIADLNLTSIQTWTSFLAYEGLTSEGCFMANFATTWVWSVPALIICALITMIDIASTRRSTPGSLHTCGQITSTRVPILGALAGIDFERMSERYAGSNEEIA